MKRIIISLILSLLLVSVFALPVAAQQEQSTTASVSVNEYISITLTDAGDPITGTGINFGSVNPGSTYGDVDQSSGTPAIKVNVGSETNVNVDIGIKGTTVTGTIALAEWKYSTDFAQTDIAGLTVDYVGVYSNVGAGSSNNFYHWITVPAGTIAGSNSITVSYKAVKTGSGF
jgi:hypothetical protein